MIDSRITVYLASIDPRESDAEHLTDSEKQRAASFRFASDARKWAASRAFLRRVLSGICHVPPASVRIEIDEYGKPLLGEPFRSIHFNLTHCDDLALVAVGAGPLGIDVEPTARASQLLGCETSFCHAQEIQCLPGFAEQRALNLLEIWTAKESILKALGTGLLQPPEKIRLNFSETVSAESDLPLNEISAQRAHRLHHPKLEHHLAFLATAAKFTEIVFQDDPA